MKEKLLELVKWGLLGLVLLPAFSPAAEEDSLNMTGFKMQQEYERSDLLFGTEMSSLSSTNGNLTALGARLGLDYSLDSSWSINPNLALVYEVGGQMTYLYSGVNGMIRYNWFHSNLNPRKELYYNEKPVVLESNSKSSKLVTMFGVEQLFLNGSTNVFPAAGATFGIGYVDSVWGQWTELSLRYSALSANSIPVNVVYLNLSFLLGL